MTSSEGLPVNLDVSRSFTLDAKKLGADAEASFNKTVAASIMLEYVHYKALEKWNGQLPQRMSGGTVPFINIASPTPTK